MADRHDADRADGHDPLPGSLPVFSSGWDVGEWEFEPGDGFWQQIDRLGSAGGLAEQMDSAMEGKSAPRVWLILHEPGRPEMSTVVALAFASELGARDQAALVLDCDDQKQSLTRWAGRLEAEGWIDLARYGTSVLTSGVTMPFAGRRGYLLGVGSFAPTDVTTAEIEQMVKRLRRQADDLILVAPADHIGELWAPVAGIRLLCWDRSVRPSTEIESLVTTLATEGYPLTGLVGFGLPMAASTAETGDVSATKTAAPELPVAAAAEVAVDVAPPTDDFETPTGEMDPEPVAERPEAAATVGQSDDAGWSDAPDVETAGSGRKGTSGVFWFLATAAVVIVGILGVYWFQYVRVPEVGGRPAGQEVVEQAPVTHVPTDRAVGELANQDDPQAGDGRLSGPDGTASMADSAQAVADTGSLAPATVVPESSAVRVEPTFSMAPYRDDVGSGGWALHLYSFPDTVSVATELTELHRRGFATEVHAIDISGKGRWFRVYVGSFGSRAEARVAAPLLKKKLRTDWANPTRF